MALRREVRRSRDLNADTPLNILFDWNAGDYRADDDPTTDPSNPLDVSMAQIKARALRAGKPLEGFNSRLLSGWGSASSAFTPPLRLGTTGPRDIVDALHKQAFACLWLSTNVTVEGEVKPKKIEKFKIQKNRKKIKIYVYTNRMEIVASTPKPCAKQL